MDITQFFKVEKRARRLDSLGQSPRKEGAAGVLEEMSYRRVDDMLERLDLNSFSEITINPTPAFIAALSDVDIRDKIEKKLRIALETAIKYVCKIGCVDRMCYTASPSIFMVGEHGSQGMCKLHYHGVIKGLPMDAMSHFLKLVKKNIGNTHFAYIVSNVKYKAYMMKSYLGDGEMWGSHSYISINFSKYIEDKN